MAAHCLLVRLGTFANRGYREPRPELQHSAGACAISVLEPESLAREKHGFPQRGKVQK